MDRCGDSLHDVAILKEDMREVLTIVRLLRPPEKPN
jgi:hypothetical protein